MSISSLTIEHLMLAVRHPADASSSPDGSGAGSCFASAHSASGW
jgi:hypothetical protein